jgi:hypothetical protein
MIYRPADMSTQQGDRANVRVFFRFSNWSPEDDLLTTPLLSVLYLEKRTLTPAPLTRNLTSDYAILGLDRGRLYGQCLEIHKGTAAP